MKIGGIARLATAIREARAASPNTTVIDAGDSLISADAKRNGSVNAQTVKKSELMADFLGMSKPEVVALGDLDLIAGPAAATDLLTTRGFTPIATNARFADPAVKTVPSIAWESAGYRFLAVNLFAPSALAKIEGATVSEPLAALDALLASAGKVDVLIACCHRFDDDLMKRFAGKDGPLRIAIDVDGETSSRTLSSVSTTIVAKPPARGVALLRVELYLKHGAPHWYRMDRYEETVEAGRSLDGELAAAAECSLADIKQKKMGENIVGDGEIVKRIEEYQAWLQQAAMAEVPEVPGAPKYVGAEACGSCHQEQLTNWKSTVHAKAWETLEADPDGGTKDPECVSCHVSGYLQPGGARRIEDTKAFRGVQCESCHAPVATHPAGEKHGKVTGDLCRKCHSETRDPEFVYEKYLEFATCMKSHDPAANRVPK